MSSAYDSLLCDLQIRGVINKDGIHPGKLRILEDERIGLVRAKKQLLQAQILSSHIHLLLERFNHQQLFTNLYGPLTNPSKV